MLVIGPSAIERGNPTPTCLRRKTAGDLRSAVHGGGSVLRRLVMVAVVALMAPAAVAWGRDFENPSSHDTAQDFTRATQRLDTPNDPGYDLAEPDDTDTVNPSTNVYHERFDLFGFPSSR